VGTNSPNLCPIISSVIFTIVNVLPLYTRNESSIKLGNIIEFLLIVCTMLLHISLTLFTFFSKLFLIYGPFHFARFIWLNFKCFNFFSALTFKGRFTLYNTMLLFKTNSESNSLKLRNPSYLILWCWPEGSILDKKLVLFVTTQDSPVLV